MVVTDPFPKLIAARNGNYRHIGQRPQPGNEGRPFLEDA